MPRRNMRALLLLCTEPAARLAGSREVRAARRGERSLLTSEAIWYDYRLLLTHHPA